MSSNGPKLPSREDREKFIRRSDLTTLNKYFNNMEKLAKRKEGAYREAYQSDLLYMSNMEIEQSGAGLRDMFSGWASGNDWDDDVDYEYTEQISNKVKGMVKDQYCPVVTLQKGDKTNSCKSRYGELETIEKVINEFVKGNMKIDEEKDKKEPGYEEQKALNKYIDILSCCNQLIIHRSDKKIFEEGASTEKSFEMVTDKVWRIYKNPIAERTKEYTLRNDKKAINFAAKKARKILANMNLQKLTEFIKGYQEIKKDHDNKEEKRAAIKKHIVKYLGVFKDCGINNPYGLIMGTIILLKIIRRDDKNQNKN